MNILYVESDRRREKNCSYWRCELPAEAINRAGQHKAKVVHVDEWALKKCPMESEWADVIIVQRNLFGEAQDQVVYWKRRGKLVLGDVDDAYDLMPRSNVSWRFWYEGAVIGQDGKEVKLNISPVQELEKGMSLCHAATMPSEVLVEHWQPFVPSYYLPNYLPAKQYFSNLSRPPHDGYWILWGGSMSHRHSWMHSGLLSAAKRVVDRRPEVQFFIHSADEIIYNLLPVPKANKLLIPWMSYPSWVNQLVQADIGLAPLWGLYDDNRSLIKIGEYALARLRWIASRSRSYQVMEGCGWLAENTADDWERCLMEAIESLDREKQEGAPAHPYVEKGYEFAWSQDIDLNADKITGLYQRLREKEGLK